LWQSSSLQVALKVFFFAVYVLHYSLLDVLQIFKVLIGCLITAPILDFESFVSFALDLDCLLVVLCLFLGDTEHFYVFAQHLVLRLFKLLLATFFVFGRFPGAPLHLSLIGFQSKQFLLMFVI
jgi:hypothetical protein